MSDPLRPLLLVALAGLACVTVSAVLNGAAGPLGLSVPLAAAIWVVLLWALLSLPSAAELVAFGVFVAAAAGLSILLERAVEPPLVRELFRGGGLVLAMLAFREAAPALPSRLWLLLSAAGAVIGPSLATGVSGAGALVHAALVAAVGLCDLGLALRWLGLGPGLACGFVAGVLLAVAASRLGAV